MLAYLITNRSHLAQSQRCTRISARAQARARSMAGRKASAAVDPEALAIDFVKFWSARDWLKVGDCKKPKQILAKHELVVALATRSSSLSFKKLDVEKAMQLTLAKARASWPHNLDEAHEARWVADMAKEIRALCSKVARASRKAPKPQWVCQLTSLLGGEVTPQVETQRDDEDEEEEAEEEEEEEEEDDEEAGTTVPEQQDKTKEKEDEEKYVYGFDPERRLAWRAKATQPDKKVFCDHLAPPPGGKATDYIVAKWADCEWTVADVTCAEFEAWTSAEFWKKKGPLFHQDMRDDNNKYVRITKKLDRRLGLIFLVHSKSHDDESKGPGKQLFQLVAGQSDEARRQASYTALAALVKKYVDGLIDKEALIQEKKKLEIDYQLRHVDEGSTPIAKKPAAAGKRAIDDAGETQAGKKQAKKAEEERDEERQPVTPLQRKPALVRKHCFEELEFDEDISADDSSAEGETISFA